MSLCRHNYVVDEQHPGHECCQNCGHVRPVFHNQDNISWLCLRSVLVFQPTRANTDGGVEASKLRAANTALK